MVCRQACTAWALLLVLAAACQADIFRWDNRRLIPGTEGIEPVPGVNLENQNLEYAGLQNKSLTNVVMTGANLNRAHFAFSNLMSADLTGASTFSI